MKTITILVISAMSISISFCQSILDKEFKQNIVGFWPFDGSGIDISGNNKNGHLVDITSGVNRWGVQNGCLNFNGSSSRISFGHVFKEIGTRNSAFSISFWFKSATHQSNGKFNIDPMGTIISDFYRNGNNCETNFFICLTLNDKSQGIVWDQKAEGKNFSTQSSGDYADDKWRHVVLVVDGIGVKKIYIDGVEVVRSEYNSNVNYNEIDINNEIDWQIGAMHFNNGLMSEDYVNYFEGSIDDLGIWNRTLSDDEIMTLFSGEITIEDNLSTKNKIVVFPNPAQNKIYINTNEGMVEKDFVVYDFAGKVLMRGKTTGVVDIKELSSGFYILKYENKSGLFFKSGTYQ